jgi:hypothetical protein
MRAIRKGLLLLRHRFLGRFRGGFNVNQMPVTLKR